MYLPVRRSGTGRPGAAPVPAGRSAGARVGPVKLRVVSGTDVLPGLVDALAGRCVLAPVPTADAAPYLAMLRPDEPVEAPDAAVVVATSGSTGDPKGVMLSAAALRFSAVATHRRLGGPGSWACALPTHHVAGLMTLTRAILAGTSIDFARGDLTDLPQPSGRSYLSVVPAQLHRALDDIEVTARLRDFAAVLVGGSAVDQALLARAQDAGVAATTTYGMSETCGGCVYDGFPLDGVRIGFEDGRITLSGPMAFSGYRLRPDLTAATLRGDTVLTQDRGRMAGDGRLEVLGRIDDVVVSGGVNVDLAAAQRRADAVLGPPERGGLVLLAVDDPRWGHRVVAVTTGHPDLDGARRLLSPVLGAAALPRELRRVPGLPYTTTGKIDRVALARDWPGRGDHGDAG